MHYIIAEAVPHGVNATAYNVGYKGGPVILIILAVLVICILSKIFGGGSRKAATSR